MRTSESRPATLLLRNGRIYPDATDPRPAGALLIADGFVVAVGEEANGRAESADVIEILDLKGRTVLPGLCDAHIHLEKYGRALSMIDCEAEKAVVLERVRERAVQLPPGAWILGHGWNQNTWGGHGTAAELDAVAPENPVYLTAKSLHAAWTNTAGMRLAGLHSASPDPPGGGLVRDASGSPTGVLLEAAMTLVAERIPQPTTEAVVADLVAAQDTLWRFGLTAVHDFDGSRCFEALQVLHSERRLGLRVLKSIPAERIEDAIALGLRGGFGDDRLRIGHLKLFADGALGPRTAAMLRDFDDQPGNTGILLLDRESIFETGVRASRIGLPLAIHAIGDRANHEVLEGLASLRAYERENFLPALRHRIEHLQLLHPDDVARPAALGVVASMQPIHATSDMPMAIPAWGERSRWGYAWKSQKERGVLLAFGSDAPVESPNPFEGLHAAVTRRRVNGAPGPEGWIPEEKLTIADALAGFTAGPAATAGMADRVGKLAPGFHADLIVLEDDPFTLDPGGLAGLRPVATMVAGAWVYRANLAAF